MAQLVARYVRDVEVAGSSLVIPTEKRNESFSFLFVGNKRNEVVSEGNLVSLLFFTFLIL